MQYLIVRRIAADCEQAGWIDASALAPHTDDLAYVYVSETWYMFTASGSEQVGCHCFLIIDSRGGARTTDDRSTCDYDEELCFMWDEPNYVAFISDEEEHFELVSRM